MNKRLIILSICLVVLATTLLAQAKVTNVDAKPAGNSIAVYYDLNQDANVRIYVSVDNKGRFQCIPDEYLSGDHGNKVKAGTYKKVLWRVLDEYDRDSFEGSLNFKVKALPSFQPFIMATGSYAYNNNGKAGGLMLGAVGAVGFYVRAETSFSALKKCTYTADAQGSVNGGWPLYSGKTSSTAWQLTGGLVVRMYIPLFLYLGGGFGQRDLYWQTIDNEWVKNSGYSYKGFAGDIGLMGHVKHVSIMLGVSSVQMKYTTLNIGLGYAF